MPSLKQRRQQQQIAVTATGTAMARPSRNVYFMIVPVLLGVFLIVNYVITITNSNTNPIARLQEENNVHQKCLTLATGKDGTVNREQPGPEDKRKCLLQTKRSPYMDIVSKAVLGFPRFGSCSGWADCSNVKPYNSNLRYYGNDWPPTGFTMIGNERLENFRSAIEEVNRNNIPGAIVEMGVWRGGAMIMAAAAQKEFKDAGGSLDRDLFLFDAFEEIPQKAYGAASSFLFNTQQDVVDAFESFGLNDSNLHYKKGLFQHTAPELQTDPLLTQIAVFRIDGNFYDSYHDALYYGYEKVPVGGIVIFDDVMSHPSVMRAWKDFKQDHGLTEDLNRIDTHSAWFRKETKVRVDMAKMKPPQDINNKPNG